ncbi:hypothetical protein ILYODFUR_006781 [Ilyodon furcidens]|uniref:Uncharacterized protein n=1 Tax=Ilyodon furcidens TaxID=33524 RepID=A0ABV0TTN9_9TELE
MRPVRSSCLLPGFFSLTLHTLVLVLLFITPSCQAVQAENVTVLEGGTAQISCRLQNYDGSIVVIQNPRRQTLFFNGTRDSEGMHTSAAQRGITDTIEKKNHGCAS